MTDVPKYIQSRWPNNEMVKRNLLELWAWFDSSGLADPHFEIEIISGEPGKFDQRLWEIILAKHLIDQGFKVTSKSEGPDFRAEKYGEVVWVEATTPLPQNVPSKWFHVPEILEKPKVISFPDEEILSRWTSALDSKKKKFDEYIAGGLVDEKDACIIAINSVLLSPFSIDLTGISGHPFPVEAVYALGPYAITFRRGDTEPTEGAHQFRDRIVNPTGGEDIRTDYFLDPSYSRISGVFGAHAGMNQVCGNPLHSVLVHNANASAPLSQGTLGVSKEYVPTISSDEISLQIK